MSIFRTKILYLDLSLFIQCSVQDHHTFWCTANNRGAGTVSSYPGDRACSNYEVMMMTRNIVGTRRSYDDELLGFWLGTILVLNYPYLRNRRIENGNTRISTIRKKKNICRPLCIRLVVCIHAERKLQ